MLSGKYLLIEGNTFPKFLTSGLKLLKLKSSMKNDEFNERFDFDWKASQIIQIIIAIKNSNLMQNLITIIAFTAKEV